MEYLDDDCNDDDDDDDGVDDGDDDDDDDDKDDDCIHFSLILCPTFKLHTSPLPNVRFCILTPKTDAEEDT